MTLNSVLGASARNLARNPFPMHLPVRKILLAAQAGFLGPVHTTSPPPNLKLIAA